LSTFTLPSGRDHHFRERDFKRSFFVSIGIHIVILVAAGSMTLFHMSGTTYSPSYSVDLVSLPSPKPAKVAKPTPAEVKTQPTPTVEKKVPKPAESSPPEKILEELKPSGGDEAARLERRQRSEELEMEIRRLSESFSSEDNITTEDRPQPDETGAVDPSVTSAPAGGNDTPSNLRFRTYYDRIINRIWSSWVVPGGVTSRTSLITVVGIRIGTGGEIEQFWIEKKSGNEYYDQSLLRAIRKANPLPPLPDDLTEAHEVGLNFKYP
jgi:colicin import membrane protein